jgi:peroxiredoxin
MENKIDVNITAPIFKINDIYDRLIDLEAYRGKKVFLGFFRHAGCPFCNLRVHGLMKHYHNGDFKNIELIFFFESKKETLKLSTFLSGVSPIPLISDPKKEWYNIYGIEDSIAKSSFGHLTTFIQTAIKAKINKLPLHPMKDGESFGTIPTEFLIDEKGIIRKIYLSKRLADRMSIDEIINFSKS